MAQSVQVTTSPSYEVRIGEGILSQAEQVTSSYSGVAILTDENVAPLYLQGLGLPAEAETIVVPAGESSKSFEVLEKVLERLARQRLDREACLVALGGGVIGDLAGLTASLYKRGINFVQCPTTLLAQVDASVGGKTAVNLPSGKNLAGTFQQPAAVLADVATLASLPAHEFESGLGEVLKTAILSGPEALSSLETDAPGLLARDSQALSRQIEACVSFKAHIVAQDPREAGPRKCLNLGHTFGHGIEHIAGFGVIPHGIAVAAGIGLALEHAATIGVLEEPDLVERVQQLSAALELPGSLAELEARYHLSIAREDLVESMRADKKNRGDKIHLVLPVRAGEMKLDVILG